MKKQVISGLVVALMSSAICLAATSASAADSNTAVSNYEKTDSGFALGMDTTLFFGSVTKNGLGYPTRLVGMSPTVGLEMRMFKDLPLSQDVRDAADRILANNPTLDNKALMKEINEQLHPGKFRYFQLGTEALFIPKIGTGAMIPFSKDIDNVAYFDIGICFPWVLNLGFVFSF